MGESEAHSTNELDYITLYYYTVCLYGFPLGSVLNFTYVENFKFRLFFNRLKVFLFDIRTKNQQTWGNSKKHTVLYMCPVQKGWQPQKLVAYETARMTLVYLARPIPSIVS